MTLQQEAYRRIDQLSDDGIRMLIDMIDKIRLMSVSGFKDTAVDGKMFEGEGIKSGITKPKDVDLFPTRPVVDLPQEDANTKRLRVDKKKKFLESAGKVDIDEEAIREFREGSMVCMTAVKENLLTMIPDMPSMIRNLTDDRVR